MGNDWEGLDGGEGSGRGLICALARGLFVVDALFDGGERRDGDGGVECRGWEDDDDRRS